MIKQFLIGDFNPATHVIAGSSPTKATNHPKFKQFIYRFAINASHFS